MKQTELFPFSKNRYYKGKMLTSADFEAEQRFVEEKSRFVGKIINGTGIACGLHVTAMDDKSILLESGMAIDGEGREIIVEKSNVFKLSSVAGFSELQTDRITLGIRYKENEVQPVYLSDGNKDYEYNRIEEAYELFVQDAETTACGNEMADFLKAATVYEDEHYLIQLVAPQKISIGQFVRINMVVTGKSEDVSNLYLECEIASSALTASKEQKEQAVFLEDIRLTKGQSRLFGYWMKVDDTDQAETSVFIRPDSMKVLVNGAEKEVTAGEELVLGLSKNAPFELALSEIGREGLEESTESVNEVVALANISLHLTAAAYIIEEVEETGVRQYLPLPRSEKDRAEYLSYFCQNLPVIETKVQIEEESEPVKTDAFGKRFATGVVEIPLGNKAREGDVYYSGEIMHGLGAGNVYVEVGYEVIEEDQSGNSTKATVYGDPELFEGNASKVAAETAVKVLNDKGSFVVAIRLLEDVRLLMLTYRWVAISLEKDNELSLQELPGNQSISAVTPTIVMKAKESHFFQAQFHNMKPCTLSYELTEQGMGEITPDGVFTAPAKEGVYEVKIYCTEQPLICTYAYAIVKK